MHDDTSGSSTVVNNDVTNNGIYGDDGDLIAGGYIVRTNCIFEWLAEAGDGSNWSGAQSPVLSNISGRFGRSDNGGSARILQPATLPSLSMQMGGVGGLSGFNLGLGSPGLGGMPGGLNMAQLAQLNAAGMNPFNMNMLGMANLSVMGIFPEAQLLAAQIFAAGGGFGQPGLALGGIAGFAGLQWYGAGDAGYGGPGRSGGRHQRANGKSGSSSASERTAARRKTKISTRQY